jgi:tripartite-type tricarboxylate transporter receptor subunit TctC
MPSLPTVAEKGLPGYEVASWFGLCAPKKTPAAIVQKISGEATEIIRTSDMQHRLENLGAQPMDMPTEKFAPFVVREIAKWSKVVRDSNARVE